VLHWISLRREPLGGDLLNKNVSFGGGD